ncbi:unnamed protein product [Rotaria sp. Silwood2]|nr:unnamed protein product [Rotaria sp. Silwood2]
MRPIYYDLLDRSIVRYFLRFTDFLETSTFSNPQQYKFPVTNENIDSIMTISKPHNLDITGFVSKEQYYDNFIQQINEWLKWFDRFIDIFQPIVEWLKNYKVDGAAQSFTELHAMRNESTITIIQMKTTIEKILKLFKPFSNYLPRICYLCNCLSPFHAVDEGHLDDGYNSTNYIRELSRSHPNNKFQVDSTSQFKKSFFINNRQTTQWSIASEKFPCQVEVTYRTIGSYDNDKKLFTKKNAAIDKYVLRGEFEAQRDGLLTIVIGNQGLSSRTIWFQIRSSRLSICHLFYGIFHIFYQQDYPQLVDTINPNALNQLLKRVFSFIDRLLNGAISLRQMTELKAIFCNKNINVREEVKKLFSNYSRKVVPNAQQTTTVINIDIRNNQEIERTCQWLQIYQYYSHINAIIDCIETFDILSIDEDKESIGGLKRLSNDDDCLLKEITKIYEVSYQHFHNLGSTHSELIKTTLEYSTVIHMMKDINLYSSDGRRRFQELRDNLTTQFQLQERNNMILNSLIITYALCESFIFKAKNLEEFISRLAALLNFEENSMKHMKGKSQLEYQTCVFF